MLDVRGRQPVEGQQIREPYQMLVRGTGVAGRSAPLAADAFAVVHREYDVGVARVDREEHGGIWMSEDGRWGGADVQGPDRDDEETPEGIDGGAVRPARIGAAEGVPVGVEEPGSVVS